MAPSSEGCELCCDPGPVSIALLRVGWSTRDVRVRACNSCGALAWRTVILEPPLASNDPSMPMLPWGTVTRRQEGCAGDPPADRTAKRGR
jgi:hypothetical protein